MISCETKTSLILYVKIYEHLENIKNGNDIKQIGSWSSTAETPGAVSRGTSGGSGHAIIDVFAPGTALAQPAPSRPGARAVATPIIRGVTPVTGHALTLRAPIQPAPGSIRSVQMSNECL